jgi:hypothetical protein
MTRPRRRSYDFFGATGAPSEPLTLLDSAEPASIRRTSGLRHTFFDTAISFDLREWHIFGMRVIA